MIVIGKLNKPHQDIDSNGHTAQSLRIWLDQANVGKPTMLKKPKLLKWNFFPFLYFVLENILMGICDNHPLNWNERKALWDCFVM